MRETKKGCGLGGLYKILKKLNWGLYKPNKACGKHKEQTQNEHQEQNRQTDREEGTGFNVKDVLI